jgi:hypothetical protein
MVLHKLFLILFCFGITQMAVAQKWKNDQPVLNVQHREFEGHTAKIKAKQYLKIKLLNQDEWVTGRYTEFTDSTISLSDTVILFNDIEILMATNRQGVATGIILTTLGAAFFGAGYSLILNSDTPTFVDDVIVGFLSFMLMAAGAQHTVVGMTTIALCVHVYNTKKWKLYVSYSE